MQLSVDMGGVDTMIQVRRFQLPVAVFIGLVGVLIAPHRHVHGALRVSELPDSPGSTPQRGCGGRPMLLSIGIAPLRTAEDDRSVTRPTAG